MLVSEVVLLSVLALLFGLFGLVYVLAVSQFCTIFSVSILGELLLLVSEVCVSELFVAISVVGKGVILSGVLLLFVGVVDNLCSSVCCTCCVCNVSPMWWCCPRQCSCLCWSCLWHLLVPRCFCCWQ